MAKRQSQYTREEIAREGPKRARPRQPDLPGTEDRAIKALEDAAATYAEIRDQRIALNVDEAKLKASLLTLMHKHGKTIYTRNGVTITIIPESENVKVKVRKPGEEEPAADGDSNEDA